MDLSRTLRMDAAGGVKNADDPLSNALEHLSLGGGQSPPAPSHFHQHPTASSTTPPYPSKLGVFFQEACSQHVYTRTKDTSMIVERPERLRAIKIGVAAAWTRLHPHQEWTAQSAHHTSEATLEEALEKLDLKPRVAHKLQDADRIVAGTHMSLFVSKASVEPEDASVHFVHPLPNEPPTDYVEALPATSSRQKTPASLIEGVHTETKPQLHTSYAAQLIDWCRSSTRTQSLHRSEIPGHLPQGDLYLSPGSEAAILGAVGACCQAVDQVMSPAGQLDTAFVSVRPPGHHCTESEPMGFCLVNNIAIAAAHAYFKHDIDRIIVLDIDLHHGNGTQDIVWRINETSQQEATEALAQLAQTSSSRSGTPRKSPKTTSATTSADWTLSTVEVNGKRPLRVCYTSLHDIFSYPCEYGSTDFVKEASLSILGGHGQWINNVHLGKWKDEIDFYERLYPAYARGLLGVAKQFWNETAGQCDKTLILISAGFDGCEHEGVGMSRHGHNLPTSFFHRFSQDAKRLAYEISNGKCVSVLEGGYSDRALTSSVMAHLLGLSTKPLQPLSISIPNELDVLSQRAESWQLNHLTLLEKMCKPLPVGGVKTKPRRSAGTMTNDISADNTVWLDETVKLFRYLETFSIPIPSSKISTGTKQTLGNAELSEGNAFRPRRTRRNQNGDDGIGVSTSKKPTAHREDSVDATPSSREVTPSIVASQAGVSTGGVKFVWKAGGFTGKGDDKLPPPTT